MSEGIKTYKDLFVWQKSIELVKQVYQVCEKFPEKEKFGICSQLQRASVSVPANIAEGWGRETKNYYVSFLRISKGSLAEVETLLIVARELGYFDSDAYKVISERTE